MIGTWRGNGHGDYPTIEKFQFGQELIFQQDGRPFIHYISRAWIDDDEGNRCATPRRRPASSGRRRTARSRWCSPTTPASSRSGTASSTPTSRGSRSSPTRSPAPRPPRSTSAGKRLYGYVEGDLLYAYDMAAMGQQLQPHIWARLQRDSGRVAHESRHGPGERPARQAPGQRLPADPAARADPGRGRGARPRHARRGAGRGPPAVLGGQRLDGLPHAGGARGARAGPPRPPERPRADVPLGERPRALPPRLPELSPGHLG